MKSSLVVVALTTFTLGCVAVSSAEVSSAASAPSSKQKTYKVRPGDHVTIIVYGHEKLGVSAQVDAAGELRDAGISEAIPAVGLSVADIQAIAVRRYKKAGVEDPQVAVCCCVTEGTRVRLVSGVPSTRLPADPVRSGAKQE
jgi:protein involved in polysaccharide export with SLBB domain